MLRDRPELIDAVSANFFLGTVLLETVYRDSAAGRATAKVKEMAARLV